MLSFRFLAVFFLALIVGPSAWAQNPSTDKTYRNNAYWFSLGGRYRFAHPNDSTRSHVLFLEANMRSQNPSNGFKTDGFFQNIFRSSQELGVLFQATAHWKLGASGRAIQFEDRNESAGKAWIWHDGHIGKLFFRKGLQAEYFSIPPPENPNQIRNDLARTAVFVSLDYPVMVAKRPLHVVFSYWAYQWHEQGDNKVGIYDDRFFDLTRGRLMLQYEPLDWLWVQAYHIRQTDLFYVDFSQTNRNFITPTWGFSAIVNIDRTGK